LPHEEVSLRIGTEEVTFDRHCDFRGGGALGRRTLRSVVCLSRVLFSRRSPGLRILMT
jgi:hypothetical protein